MRAGAQLPRLHLARRVRVVDHPQRRVVPVELVLEPVLGQADRQREDPPQRLREPAHGAVILEPDGLQAGRLGRPLVAHEAGTVVERLLQVARALLAEARRQALGHHREVHQPALHIAGLADPRLARLRQVEERARR